MKMKEFGPRGGASLAPPLDPPMVMHLKRLMITAMMHVMAKTHTKFSYLNKVNI